MRWMLRSKIHKARVTEANINYVGSITIDGELLKKVGIWSGEKVLVVSNTSGVRIETYAVAGKKGSRTVCMNGAAARLIKKNEEIIIMGFELTDKPIKSKIVLVDRENNFIKFL